MIRGSRAASTIGTVAEAGRSMSAGHPDRARVRHHASVPSRVRRARGGAAEQVLLREAGAVRASGRRGQAPMAASSTETCCHASTPNSRREQHRRDDIPNPTDGPAPEGERRPRPAGWRARRGSAGDGRLFGDGAAAIGWLRDGAAVALRACGAASAGATVRVGSCGRLCQELNLHREREAHRAHQAGTVGAHRRERLLAGPLAARIAPLDASVDRPGPAARCGPARARARLPGTGRNPAGR